MRKAPHDNGKFSFRNLHPPEGDGREELLSGLRQRNKAVDPKWFYDAKGSQLFEHITLLPEYYPSRTEKGILQANAHSISEYCGPACVLLEPGSGNCEKVRLLLDALQPAAYVPIDISAEFLRDAAHSLSGDFPWLRIEAICADFNRDWSFVQALPTGKRVVFYPGSTIGNLEPPAAEAFLSSVRGILGASGGALIGVDLHKSSERLNAAYNDSAGLTAAFNLNLLSRLNVLLGTDFDPATFRHHAYYNTDRQRIEMHLVSEREQTVTCNGEVLHFARGESIHTENSYKYTIEDFAALAARAGLVSQQSWIDPDHLFSVHYLVPG